MAFRVRKVFGTFEKRAPERDLKPDLCGDGKVFYQYRAIRPTSGTWLMCEFMMTRRKGRIFDVFFSLYKL